MDPLVYNTEDFKTFINKIASEFVDQYLNYMVYGCSFNDLKDEYIKLHKLENQNLENNQKYKIFEFVSLTIKKDFNYEFSEYKDLSQQLYNYVYSYFYKHFTTFHKPVTETDFYDEKKLNTKIMNCLNKNYLLLKQDFKKEIKNQIKILTSNFLFYSRFELYYKIYDIYSEFFDLENEMENND